jgi:hypothetical protein
MHFGDVARILTFERSDIIYCVSGLKQSPGSFKAFRPSTALSPPVGPRAFGEMSAHHKSQADGGNGENPCRVHCSHPAATRHFAQALLMVRPLRAMSLVDIRSDGGSEKANVNTVRMSTQHLR